jgi:predicted Zn-dependent protease
VVVIPLGHVGNASVRAFAQTMRSELGLDVRVGRRLPLTPELRDAARKQLVGERLVRYLQESGAVTKDRRTAVIGLTNQDLYPATARWSWSFAERKGRIGVVSVARMDPWVMGLEQNRPLLLRRLRTFAVRYGALLALREPLVIEPRSPLFGALLSVDDLDFMEPSLHPRPYSPARRSWLAAAGRACRSAGATWKGVQDGLRSARAAQALPLLRRWAAADAQLAPLLAPGSSSLPQPARALLVRALRTRAAYLRRISASTGMLKRFDLRHVQSLGGTLHAAFLESGSRVCGRETS